MKPRMTRTSQSNFPRELPLCRSWILRRHGNRATTHTVMWYSRPWCRKKHTNWSSTGPTVALQPPLLGPRQRQRLAVPMFIRSCAAWKRSANATHVVSGGQLAVDQGHPRVGSACRKKKIVAGGHRTVHLRCLPSRARGLRGCTASAGASSGA